EAETDKLSGEKSGMACADPAYTAPENAAIIIPATIFFVILISLNQI
nr:hypothetical protein [Enterobacter cloacae]